MNDATKRWGRGAIAFLISTAMVTGGVPAQALAEAIPPQGEVEVEPSGNENTTPAPQNTTGPEIVVQESDEPANEPAITTQGDDVSTSYAAIVGQQSYGGIDDALQALFSSDADTLTLTLLKDVKVTVPKTMDTWWWDHENSRHVNRTRVIDLNGHTITFNGSDNYFINVINGDLIIQDSPGNGKIIGAGIQVGNGSAYAYYSPHPTVRLGSGIIQDAKEHGVNVGNRASFTMDDGAITGSKECGVKVVGYYYDYESKQPSAFTQNGGTIADSGKNGVDASIGDYTLNAGSITNSGENGAVVSDGTITMAAETSITGSKEHGVSVTSGSFVQKGGTVDQNGKDGVHAGTNSTVTQEQPGIIADNGGYGVYVDGSENDSTEDSYTYGVSIKGTVTGNARTGVYTVGRDNDYRVGTTIDGAKIIDNGKGVPDGENPDQLIYPEQGGGVYVGTFANLTLKGSTVSGNKAQNGAGVYVETASIEGTYNYTPITIEGNKIGAPVQEPEESVEGQDDTDQTEETKKLTGNIATGNGGGVYIESKDTDDIISLSTNTIEGNEAANGAGVYVKGANQNDLISTITLSGNTITQNTAQEGAPEGDATTQDDSQTTPTGGDGGGLYMDTCRIAPSGDTISKNAATNGAGVYVKSGKFNVSSGFNPASPEGGSASITENVATGDGGGLYVAGTAADELAATDAAAVTESITITKNSAQNGGGIFVAGGKTFLSANITGNTASEQGGGVHHASENGVFAVVGAASVKDNEIKAAKSEEIVTQSDEATEEKTFNNVFLGQKDGGGVNVITVTGQLSETSNIFVTVDPLIPTKDQPGDVLITTGYTAKNNNTPFPHFQCDVKHNDVYVGWNKGTQGTTDDTEAALKLHTHTTKTPWNYKEKAVEGSKKNEKVVDAWCISEESIAQDACSIHENDPLTLKISAKDATYDGKEYNAEKSEVTVEATYQRKAFDEWGLEKGSEIGLSVPVVEYYQGDKKLDAAPKDAGTYTAKATFTATVPVEEQGLGAQSSGQEKTFSATCDFTIAPAPLTVTAKDKTVNFGDAPANDGVNYDGLVGGETEAVLSGTLAYDYAGYKAGSSAGTYKITPSGLTSNNYAITFKPGTLTVAEPKEVTTTYSAHVQGIGDTDPVQNGAESGTTGQGKRLESIKASIENQPYAGDIEYRSHVQGIGWESEWAKNGAQSGTSGKAKRVEAIQMRLTGDMGKNYSVWYRVYSQTYGWLGWTKDGEAAGTSAMAKRAEAYEVLVLKKGETPEGYDATKAAFVSTPAGKVHVQKIGWTNRRGTSFGTTGKGRRVEALRLKLSGLPWDGKIVYQSYVQGIGWQGKKADGALSGTSGKGKRIEAVRISLRGEAAEHLSVWYRVHSQKYGWLGWAKDGENAGTAKRSKRAESVQVQLLPKGAVPAGYDASVPAFKTK